jgi:hypothetical protein
MVLALNSDETPAATVVEQVRARDIQHGLMPPLATVRRSSRLAQVGLDKHQLGAIALDTPSADRVAGTLRRESLQSTMVAFTGHLLCLHRRWWRLCEWRGSVAVEGRARAVTAPRATP